MSTTAFIPIQIQASISLEEWRQFQEWRTEKQRRHREELQKQRDAEGETEEGVVAERDDEKQEAENESEGDKKRKRRSFGREYKLEAISYVSPLSHTPAPRQRCGPLTRQQLPRKWHDAI